MGCLGVLRRTLVLLVLLLTGQVLYAQGVASISGTIRDSSGAALPGATIVLEDLKGGPPRTVQSGPEGLYAFTGLTPGTYRVTVSLDGFDSAAAELELAAGQSITKDVSLALASFFDNVTVSPEKREAQILEVPASITAITGANIQDQGVTNIKDIAATIPSLSIIETGPGQQRAQIRGISSPLNLPTIGTYVDEAPVDVDSVGAGLDVRLLDLERVEVLRGPQGTLYGAGSMGGTIKYITADPRLDRPSFMVDGTLGWVADGTDTYKGSVVANLPLVKGKLGVRVLAGGEHSPGWVDYTALNEKDVNDGDSKTLRVKGLWVASEKLTASLMYQRQDSDYNGQPYADEDLNAPYLLDQPRQSTSDLTNLVLNYNFGAVTLLSSTGYLARSDHGVTDFSAIYVPLFALFGFPPGTVDTVANISDSHADLFTEEVRVASTGKGPLGWTAGVFFRDYKLDGSNNSETTPNPLPFEIQTIQGQTKSQQFSVFGNADYAFTSRVSGTVGLRWFRDHREQTGETGIFAPPKPDPAQSGDFTSVDPRFVFSFRPAADTLIYASAAKGFRSGGFNGPLPCAIPTAFDPEKLWTYEVGSSVSTSQGRFVAQGSFYYNDWTDIQTLTLCPNVPVRATDNSGQASGKGVDLQITITPLRPLKFTFSTNFNDSEYDTTSLAHEAGDPIDYVPDYTMAVAADYSFRIAKSYPSVFHVDYQQTGEYTITIRNLGIPPLNSDTIQLLNARLGVGVGPVQFSVYAQNLLDENGAIQPAIVAGGVLVPVRPQPRTLGVGFGLRF